MTESVGEGPELRRLEPLGRPPSPAPLPTGSSSAPCWRYRSGLLPRALTEIPG